jgi:hypothetical protein
VKKKMSSRSQFPTSLLLYKRRRLSLFVRRRKTQKMAVISSTHEVFCVLGDGSMLESSERLGSGSYGVVMLCKIARANAPALRLPAGRYAAKVSFFRRNQAFVNECQMLDGSVEPERVRNNCPGFCSGSVLRECSVTKTLERYDGNVLSVLRIIRNPERDAAIMLMDLECGVTITEYFETFGLRADPTKLDTDRRLKVCGFFAKPPNPTCCQGCALRRVQGISSAARERHLARGCQGSETENHRRSSVFNDCRRETTCCARLPGRP